MANGGRLQKVGRFTVIDCLFKLDRFADFNKHCLKPALEEVNHLTDFVVDVMAIKKGRAVEKLQLSWFKKAPAEMRAAFDEREKSRVGRQVRWRGSVDVIRFDDDPDRSS